MTDKIIVFSTCAGVKEAKKLAGHLVEQRLAACVNVVKGMESYYRWKGKVAREPEVLLIIKTSRELFSRLRAEWERLHSYEIPELIAVPIVEGAASYMDWLERELAAQ
ncbi:MAG: divalent-cation tolerance protein CutA [Acidobacteria bacterium]|nr:divalent-cation tolerance protein CutA [Acidobacteriota bacterium]